jgi:hypothetical protein
MLVKYNKYDKDKDKDDKDDKEKDKYDKDNVDYGLFINLQIKHTQSMLSKSFTSINKLINIDELIKIGNFIQFMKNTDKININNIHSVLKLISNLIKLNCVIESSNTIFNFNIDEIIYPIFSCESLDKLNDGNIISIINIYCSKKYKMVLDAIELINKYNIHKTSSYIPIFNYLIESKDYDQALSDLERASKFMFAEGLQNDWTV